MRERNLQPTDTDREEGSGVGQTFGLTQADRSENRTTGAPSARYNTYRLAPERERDSDENIQNQYVYETPARDRSTADTETILSDSTVYTIDGHSDEENADQTCTVNRCTSKCVRILLFLFCVKRGMRCCYKFALALLWSTGVTVCMCLITSLVIFSDSQYHLSPSDTRIIGPSSMTLFCRRMEISAENLQLLFPAGISQRLPELHHFTVSLMSDFPHLILDKREQVEFRAPGIKLDQHKLRFYVKSFYLHSYSRINVTVNVLVGNIYFTLLASSRSFLRLDDKEKHCRDDSCALISDTLAGADSKSYSQEALAEGHYHFMFGTTSSGSIFSTIIFLDKTSYDTSGLISTCSTTGVPSFCYFDINFSSTEVILVTVPFINSPATSMVEVTASCSPRITMYLLTFGLPFFVLVLAYMIVVPATCQLFMPNSRAQRGRIVDRSSDILATEGTSLIYGDRPPSYERAISLSHTSIT